MNINYFKYFYFKNMKLNNVSKDENKIIKISDTNLSNVKSKYILSKIFKNMNKNKSLEIVKYNKKIQNRLNLSIQDYKEYSEIEIEVIPTNKRYGKFININENEKSFYHIFFNDNKEEIKSKYNINEEDKITKIRIIIDYKIKSFKNLFKFIECIEYINFKNFNRNNITDMSEMFFGCSSLKELNLSNFNTNNVTNMKSMFSRCSSLKKLNLSNFNTNNVTNMSFMFYRCSSLIELNIINFNTNNVINMSGMFDGCSSLKELNLSNFNTNNVINMSWMLSRCSSLKELNLSNFNINNVIKMKYMFSGCSNDLKKKIIVKNKDIKDEAFDEQ